MTARWRGRPFRRVRRPASTRRLSCATATRRRYLGKGVEKAVLAVDDEIAPQLVGIEASEQRLVDQVMLDLDGTPNKAQPRCQRHPGCVARGGKGCRRVS